ncbi:MAG: hypothetical protein MUC47_04440 [Candidatus Kapabacteria bacterium]|jgi:hypothetical protein|nr:hypothetical protein [Candidatus Kapabacteria bacterium]
MIKHVSALVALAALGCTTSRFSSEARAKCDLHLQAVVDRYASAEMDSTVRLLAGVREESTTFDASIIACGATVVRLGPTIVGITTGTKAVPCIAALPGVQRLELDRGAQPLD